MKAPFFHLLFVITSLLATTTAATPLKLCATIPELADIAKRVGGDEVEVITFAHPGEDPHFVQPRPSLVTHLSQADLLIQNGLELELGWLPVMIRGARNSEVRPGAGGFLDISTAITPLQIPSSPVDRSMGDVHPRGNPHFLLDPANGLRVARAIERKLSELRPGKAAVFGEKLNEFKRELGGKLFGSQLAEQYDPEKLATLHELGKLDEFLSERGAKLGGWVGESGSLRGKRVVGDHLMYPYLARRYGFEVVAHLEPKPGIPPSAHHLEELIGVMKGSSLSIILTNPYYDRRHSEFVSKNTGAKIALIAHQVGSRPGTESFIKMSEYNVQELLKVVK